LRGLIFSHDSVRCIQGTSVPTRRSWQVPQREFSRSFPAAWRGSAAQRTLVALTRCQKVFHLTLKEREFGLNNVPDHVVRKSVVTVNQHVSEGDDPSVFSYSANCFRIASGKAVRGFADDLELPFDCRPKERIVSIGG
jgi:hypothetical protein